MLLKPGTTCWRREKAQRAALLIDMADYFAAAKAAMAKAKHSIHFLNWAFDPTTYFHPEAGGAGPEDDQIGPFLRDLACANPQLDVRVLCWRSALPIAATQNFFPHRARKCFHGTPVDFRLDDHVPMGACHHQKVVVIDDKVAFCGGGDIGADRWDTIKHLDNDRRRWRAHGKCFESRHEVMSLVDGPAARALGDLFRRRWRRATGEELFPPGVGEETADDPWPDCVEPDFRNVMTGLSRTEPKWRDYREVREVETLHLAAIAGAKQCIYLENQYFTSPLIAEALASRLSEPDGPEVVIVSTQHSPSWFDQITMDRTRSLFIQRLMTADAHKRFKAFSPVTAKGRTIIVHAKLAIIDDQLLRVGSANLNNRSSGFDTECDLSIEVGAAEARAQVRRLRTRLIAHWLGRDDAEVDKSLAEAGSLGAAIVALQRGGKHRLRAIKPEPLSAFAAFIATFHMGDPAGPGDSWRPWGRRSASERRLRNRAEELARVGLESAVEELSPETV